MKMPRPKKSRLVSAVPWWTPEQFAILKQISADADALGDTYRDRKANAGRLIRHLQASGLEVRRVDLAELVQWCTDRGVALDGKARSRFVAEKAHALELGSSRRGT